MVRERVLVDVTHMSPHSLADTFALLDGLDPERATPLIASHIACRFGSREYNLIDETIARIAERRGVMGVILCDHVVTEGLRRRRTRTFEQSIELICRHVDRIHDVTGSHDHTAIGSDLDGYIEPTVSGIATMADLPRLRAALAARYGEDVAQLICRENPLRVLRAGWR